MTQKLLLVLLVTGLVVLALGAWTVDALRWLAAGGRRSGAATPAAA
jgi:hypothetical protein